MYLLIMSTQKSNSNLRALRLDDPTRALVQEHLKESGQAFSPFVREAIRFFLDEDSARQERERQQAEIIIAAINTAMSAVLPTFSRQLEKEMERAFAPLREALLDASRLPAMNAAQVDEKAHLIDDVLDQLMTLLSRASGQALPEVPSADRGGADVRPIRPSMHSRPDTLPTLSPELEALADRARRDLNRPPKS